MKRRSIEIFGVLLIAVFAFVGIPKISAIGDSDITPSVSDTQAESEYGSVDTTDSNTPTDAEDNDTTGETDEGTGGSGEDAGTGGQGGSVDTTDANTPTDAGSDTDNATTPPTADDEETTYSISGRVVDTSGNAISGAIVTIINLDNRKTMTTIMTDSSGNYTIAGVPNGSYSVRASKSGYEERNYKDIIDLISDIDVDRMGDIILSPVNSNATGGNTNNGSGSNSGNTSNTTPSYTMAVRDNRSIQSDPVYLAGGISTLDSNVYLIVSDSPGTNIRSLIAADSSLSSYDRIYICDMKLMDSVTGGEAITDFQNCTIQFPVPAGMSMSTGTIRVVSVKNNTLDKTIPCQQVFIGGKEYVQLSTTHFTDFAFIYTASTDDDYSANNSSNRYSTYIGPGGYYYGGNGYYNGVRYSSDDDDDDDDDDDSSSSSDSDKPKLTKVYWKKDNKSTFYWNYSDKATGYRLEYSTDSSFKKSATKSIGRKKKNGTVKDIKAGTTYYVRVKAYEVVDGKKEWSSWSHRIVVKRSR